MPRTEGELFKDKIEVSLDGRQIFYLFFGGAVIASMVFVLGVMVGRRVEARALAGVTAGPSAVSDPLAALDQLEHEDTPDLLFPAALRSGTDSDDEPSEVDSAVATVVNTQDGTQGDAPVETAPSAQPAAPIEAKASAPAGKPPVVESEPAKKQAAKPVDRRAPRSRKGGRFTLQLSSFQEPAEADAFLLEMKAAGFSPYIVEGEVNGTTWYRVRLGQYPTYNDAIAAKRDFEKSQRIIAYVTRVKR